MSEVDTGVTGLEGALAWSQAYHLARTCAAPLAGVRARLDEASGSILAAPVSSPFPDPPEDVALADGFAVCGEGPWQLHPASPETLLPGAAARVVMGQALPRHTDAVVRNADAVVEQRGELLTAIDELTGLPDERARPALGAAMLRAGAHGASGELLVPGGLPVTPTIVSIAAAAGLDHLEVIPPPVVGVLVLGSNLLTSGPPRHGRPRDALGHAVQAFVGACGARGNPAVRAPDTAELLLREIDDAQVDVLITTGSTEPAPGNHVREVLRELDARWLIDGVEVAPGAQMLMARLPDGRFLIGLPGWPQAAMAGLITLVAPLIAALRGAPLGDPEDRGVLASGVEPEAGDTVLAPVHLEAEGSRYRAHPLPAEGPAGLQGWAQAQAVAVLPPGAGTAGDSVPLVPIPGARWPRLRTSPWDDPAP